MPTIFATENNLVDSVSDLSETNLMNNTIKTFSQTLALEILEKQLKCQSGEWPGLSLSTLLEVRLTELQATLVDENEKEIQ